MKCLCSDSEITFKIAEPQNKKQLLHDVVRQILYETFDLQASDEEIERREDHVKRREDHDKLCVYVEKSIVTLLDLIMLMHATANGVEADFGLVIFCKLFFFVIFSFATCMLVIAVSVHRRHMTPVQFRVDSARFIR